MEYVVVDTLAKTVLNRHQSEQAAERNAGYFRRSLGLRSDARRITVMRVANGTNPMKGRKT